MAMLVHRLLFSVLFAILFCAKGALLFADCGQPHGPGESPSTPSTEGGGATGGGSVSTPPSTDSGQTVGGHLGTTFDPSSARGPSTSSPEFEYNAEVTKLNERYLKDLKIKPTLWQDYLKYMSDRTRLIKAKQEAQINERVRKAGWENSSGLSHARERFQATSEKAVDSSRQYEQAVDKGVEAHDRYTKLKEDLREAQQKEQELIGGPDTNRWWKAREEVKQLEREIPKALEVRESNSARANQLREVRDEARQEAREAWNQVERSLEKYREMEARYHDTRNASVPSPAATQP